MTVFTYGNDKRVGACKDFVESRRLPPKYKMLTILPIPSSRDGIFVNSTDFSLSSLATEVEGGEVVLCYNLPETTRIALESVGALVVDAALDEQFLLDNAYFTAVGALHYLLGRGDFAPSDITVGVVGYGRIGRALLRILLPLGYRVCVYSTRASVVDCLSTSGVSAEIVGRGAAIPAVDYLINTAPDRLFVGEAKGKTEIIELASGDNFEVEDITRLPSLPQKFCPVSAGRAYAAALLRALGGEK